MYDKHTNQINRLLKGQFVTDMSIKVEDMQQKWRMDNIANNRSAAL